MSSFTTTNGSLEGSVNWHVPEYEVLEFAPKRTCCCVCVFVLNEGERVRTQLRQMREFVALGDIIIGDGGSTDGALSAEFLAEQNVRTLLTKIGPGRLSAQMRMAFAYVLDQGYEAVVVMDGNNKDGVAALPSFYAALREGYDHIQGSRYMSGGRAVNTPFLRHWAVTLIHAPAISVAARWRYTDTTNGFRAYSRQLLADPRIQPFRDVFVGYELHYYLAIRAARLGFRVKEIPVTRAYPKGEKTPTKIVGWRGNWMLLRTLCAVILGRYDPPPMPSKFGG